MTESPVPRYRGGQPGMWRGIFRAFRYAAQQVQDNGRARVIRQVEEGFQTEKPVSSGEGVNHGSSYHEESA